MLKSYCSSVILKSISFSTHSVPQCRGGEKISPLAQKATCGSEGKILIKMLVVLVGTIFQEDINCEKVGDIKKKKNQS